MKKISFLKTKKFEGYDEIKVSILVHLAILLVLTVFFAYNSAEAQPKKKKVVPIRLLAPVKKAKTGSGKKIIKKQGSKKAQGKARKVRSKKATAKKKKIVKAKKPTQKIKKVKKTAKKQTKKVVKKQPKKVTTTKQQIAKKAGEQKLPKKANGTAKKPSVVQKPTTKVVRVPKPTHNSPTFESVSQFKLTETMPTELDDEMAPMDMGEPISALSPEEFLPEMDTEEKQTFSPENSGLKENRDSNNAGAFEVGSIEAFGGSSENFIPPQIISKKQPEYPEWARKKGVRGNAVYRILIQESGTVGDVVTMNSTIDPKLAITGAQALRRWVFSPVLVDGEPKETWVKVAVQYSLN
eukprot:Anaeramoba_ignava/c20692_g1_i2.p2 GENE.c20692_g1_i2~~c20692_g1_i2.p2  ORF type:complete len:352 (-),score=69.43 c20692_g1_i2:154-1209(-)